MKGACIMLAAVVIAWIAVLMFDTAPSGWDVSYPMANSRIAWEGAGSWEMMNNGNQKNT